MPELPHLAETAICTTRADVEDIYEVAQEELNTGHGLGRDLLRGMNLDLSLAERKVDGGTSTCLQEGSIIVNFELPDGSYGESLFKLGQTTEVLKSFVESEYGIPMDQQSLLLDGKNMLNPLSLMDFCETKGADEILIVVDGPMPACRK